MAWNVKDLTYSALQAMEADPLYQAAAIKCPLEYTATHSAATKITSTSFDVVGNIRYGSNEGIIGYASMDGRWSSEGESSLCIVTFKTLYTDKDAYINMGLIVTLFCYYANKFVEEHC